MGPLRRFLTGSSGATTITLGIGLVIAGLVGATVAGAVAHAPEDRGRAPAAGDPPTLTPAPVPDPPASTPRPTPDKSQMDERYAIAAAASATPTTDGGAA